MEKKFNNAAEAQQLVVNSKLPQWAKDLATAKFNAGNSYARESLEEGDHITITGIPTEAPSFNNNKYMGYICEGDANFISQRALMGTSKYRKIWGHTLEELKQIAAAKGYELFVPDRTDAMTELASVLEIVDTDLVVFAVKVVDDDFGQKRRIYLWAYTDTENAPNTRARASRGKQHRERVTILVTLFFIFLCKQTINENFYSFWSFE